MITYEKGTITLKGEVTSGVSQKGNTWAKMTLVVSVPTSQNSFKYIALNVTTDRIEDVQKFNAGEKVEVGYVVSAREWNGKWYNNVDLVSIKADAGWQPAPAPAPAPAEEEENDLPF